MNLPSALFVDLYELTMAQVYYERGMTGQAVFELSVRKLPPGWDYLIAAGLERTLDYLAAWRFTDAELAYVSALPQFDRAFIEQLRALRFTGAVWAPPEGTLVYPHEPLIQVIAPLPEAQLVETAIVNQLAYPTLAASKAARAVDAAGGKTVIEFGGRRAHGAEAALAAARAAYLGGFDATSSLEAGRRDGIPVTGTMAHSFVLAEGDEPAAFEAMVARYPGTTLLVDTYDTARGIERAIAVAQRRGAGAVGAIRIDSGDFLEQARQARAQLDAAGLSDVRIVVSGGLDEYQIAALERAGAPIDVYACGTLIVAPADAPTLDSAYKMVEYDGRAVRKLSAGKVSIGGRKQVWRRAAGDVIAPFRESTDADRSDAAPLLEAQMVNGRRVRPHAEPLRAMRERANIGRRARSVEIAAALLS